MNRNRNGIPIADPPGKGQHCINRKSGLPKRRFLYRFTAERWLAENIPTWQREAYSVYACGDHFHLTTALQKADE